MINEHAEVIAELIESGYRSIRRGQFAVGLHATIGPHQRPAENLKGREGVVRAF